jgi:hypothetical protein
MGTSYLFRLSNQLFAGFSISFGYLVATGAAVWLYQRSAFSSYIQDYALSFNCLTSSGVIIMTALFVILTKGTVPEIIENSFERAALEKTSYFKQKSRYLSLFGSIAFSANYVIAAFFIFYFCTFPVTGLAMYFLIGIACVQYAMGVYVGRKLYFIAYMLGAISDIKTTKDVFREERLYQIITYVNILSTITVIGTYLHVQGFYWGPFRYTSMLGPTLKVVLLLPALIATPVMVLFNFYPRVVLRRLYSRSIESEVLRLTEQLKDEHLSEFERRAYTIEYDRLQRDEMKSSLQLTLSDLPMGVTLIVMIIGLIVKS